MRRLSFLKLLYDKLTELHMKHADTSDEWKYPLPSFKARDSLRSNYAAKWAI